MDPNHPQNQSMKLDMRSRIDDACMELVMKLIKEREFQVRGEPLLDIVQDCYGRSFKRGMKERLKTCRNRVIEDMQEEKIDPEDHDYPFRFICNSIVIHALELSTANSSYYEDLKEVRQENLFEEFQDELDEIHEERNSK